MQIKWLNRENNKKLIVFFNGWGCIKQKNLMFNDFDVILFQDYGSLKPIADMDFSSYQSKYLIAWSLGVYVCNYYYDIFKNFDSLTAINGTQNPIDDNFGIPVKAYNMTIENFNELTCNKFLRKIGTNSLIHRDIESLKQELISIQNLKIDRFLNFSKAIVSKNDKIFPYKNMINFWNTKGTKIIETGYNHYLFDNYSYWSDLI